jgi:hypothetical protein
MGDYVAPKTVKNLSDVDVDEILSENELRKLVSLAEAKVDDDLEGSDGVKDSQKERLALYLTCHYVKMKMRGAWAVESEGDMDLESVTGETMYSHMYEKELPQSTGIKFTRAGG